MRQLIKILEALDQGCPLATQSPAHNQENRDKAIENYNYGPEDIGEPGDFWKEFAKRQDKDLETAKTMKCGTCAAFDTSSEMLKCIGDEPKEVGYCKSFKFTCSAQRTCDAWVEGGPITK